MREKKYDLPHMQIAVKVSGDDTGGSFAAFEEITVSGAGTPLHIHRQQWEMLEVIEGKYRIRIGEREIIADAGTIAIVPPGTPHAFLNINPTSSKLRFVLSPGLRFENFIEEMSTFRELPAMDQLCVLLNKYGMELIGPPLNFPS
jgi:quercetin dioxygenase-like cupin family protein